MQLNSTERNSLDAVKYVLWQLKINVSPAGLKKDLCFHPDFPNLLSVTDSLSKWNIPNLATRLNSDQLRDIPLPALAFVHIRGGILAPIKSVSSDTIEWLDTVKGWQKEPIDEFQRKWSGIAVLVEPSQQSGETDYIKNIRKHRKDSLRLPFILGCVLICLALTIGLNWQSFTSITELTGILIATKLIGSLITSFLLWQSLDRENPFLQSICHFGSRSNCNSILQSNAANVTSWLTWSEVGFFYFTGGLFTIIFGLMSGNHAITDHMFLLSATALPYTLYSIYYQGFVARQWCMLCLATQIVLWSEFLAFIIFSEPKFQLPPTADTALQIALANLIPITLWAILKKPLSGSMLVYGLQRELQRTKFNEVYIKAIFNAEDKMPPLLGEMRTLNIGSKTPKNTITVVTNPLCGPCAKVHAELTRLIDTHSDVAIQFIFIGPPPAMDIARILFSAPQENVHETMDSWYSNIRQNAQMWINKHSYEVVGAEISKQLHLHSRWCEFATINATPILYINSIKLPTAFSVSELRDMLPIIAKIEDTALAH